ncbi:hypothetical protein FQA39_LY06273 [Lamprigera yunnana]|nr:hypothetical protein FQA39_LY06273 [Lamprigera yunnana]
MSTVAQCYRWGSVDFMLRRSIAINFTFEKGAAKFCKVVKYDWLSTNFERETNQVKNQELKTEPEDYEEMFKCKEYDPAEGMDAHTGPIRQYFCNGCNFMTMERDSLIEYSKIASNVQYFCEKCNFKMQSECSKREHLRIHNLINDKNIKECNTQWIFSLSSQFKTAKSRNKYMCNECNYTTLNKNNLKRHLKIHMSNKYICKECDYRTEWKYLLMQHIKKHTGDEYKCNECDYRTVRKYLLKVHLKIHTGDEYKCKECNYKTVRKDVLQKHVKIHTGDEYKCKECDYRTVRKDLLKQHVKIHTGDEYKCKECDYKTVRKNRLMEHVKTHTGDEYKCKECDYETVWKHLLKQHVKIHTGDEYKCKDCDYKTVRKNCLMEHIKIHTGDEYKCKECDYKTVRKNHLMEHFKIHMGEEYKCKECDYTTVWSSNLKQHVKIHSADIQVICKPVRNVNLKQIGRVIIPFTVEQDKFILEAYFRNGQKDVDGKWKNSVRLCVEEYQTHFQNIELDDDVLCRHILGIVSHFHEHGSVCKGKSTGHTTVLTEEVVEDVRTHLERSSTKPLMQLAQQTGNFALYKT